ECYLTDWTAWSPCQLNCMAGTDLGLGSVQVRSRAVVAQEPENLLQCPDQEWEARPCTGGSPGTDPLVRGPVFGIQMDDGLLEELVTPGVVPALGRTQRHRCGDGLRYRNVTCFVSDGSGREVGSPVDEELCWDLEQGVDGDKLVAQTTWTSLEKNTCMMTPPPPPLWLVSEPWSVWKVSNVDLKENCGEGVQTRKVRCMLNTIDGPSDQAEDYLCDPEEMPLGARDSRLPCPEDCVLSDWASWSTCPLLSLIVHFVPSDWSTCQLSERAVCGVGVKTRMLDCVRSDGKSVDLKFCKEVGYIEEACIIPLPVRTASSVSGPNWSRCSKSCGSGVKVRSKWLREKPYNGGRPCPKTGSCQSEPWSVWKVSNVDLKENCGEGVQTRKVRCMLNTIDGPSDQAEDYLCDPEEMPLGARDSRLPCPEDCVLSDWASWSTCPLPCSGNRTRERSAYPLRQPGQDKACPDTLEAEPCRYNANCFHYSYNITDWSTCQLSERAVCGVGVKTRMLDCVRSDGKSVDLKFCKEVGKSKKRDQCKNNQLSARWTETPSTGPLPTSNNAQPVGNWSDCVLPEGARVEGQLGMKDNRLVETSRCNSHGYIEEACIIPCPSDCKLSEWSNWSRCSKSCGSGVKVRSKWLREKPYNGGRPCPKLDHVNQVYEVVPCLSDCGQYVWLAEPWSVWKVSNVDLRRTVARVCRPEKWKTHKWRRCQLVPWALRQDSPGAQEACGPGLQARAVSCRKQDGGQADIEECLKFSSPMPTLTQPCQNPCQEDCQLTAWSKFSSCTADCVGVRTRKRLLVVHSSVIPT
ncbi:hypothetical protein CRUP_022082, partial [Coryphaenoides rupestris]